MNQKQIKFHALFFNQTCLSFYLFIIFILILFPLKAKDDSDYHPPCHGMALFGPHNLKVKPDQPLAYVNPNAPQGGHLIVGRVGDFTKLNRWSLRGTPVYEINERCRETPMKVSHDDDEPYSLYGQLAQSVEMAKDGRSLIFNINPNAHFSDGHPVTAEDFKFSYELLFDPGHVPTMKHLFKDVTHVEILNSHRIRFNFANTSSEVPLIIAERLEVFPKHVYGAPGKRYGEDFNETPPIASGPYVVDKVEFGKFITFKKDPNWWGQDLPINQGCHNFQYITYKYYKDPLSRREALKAGEIHSLGDITPKDWVKEFKGKYIQKNYMIKESFKHDRVISMPGIFFNLRREIFKDPWVRRAIVLAFDHKWTNRELYYDLLKRAQGAFTNNSLLSINGTPKGKVLQKLHELRSQYKDDVPFSALNCSIAPPGHDLNSHDTLQLANLLLEKAGWEMGEDGIRIKNNKKFIIHIPITQASTQNILEPFAQQLEKVGVQLVINLCSIPTLTKKRKEYDFDLLIWGYNYRANRNPGTKYRAWWGKDNADNPGSHNVMGLKNEAVEYCFRKIILAKNRQEHLFYCEILNRIIAASDIYIPLFYRDHDWGVHWNRFGHFDIYASHLEYRRNIQMYWWEDPNKVNALKEAMLNQKPLKLVP